MGKEIKNSEEVMRKLIKEAIKEYGKEQKEEQKKKVLHNTKLLMKYIV